MYDDDEKKRKERINEKLYVKCEKKEIICDSWVVTDIDGNSWNCCSHFLSRKLYIPWGMA